MNNMKPKFWNRKISLISKILIPLSIIYLFLLFLKQKLTKKESFKIPIICIGNIYLGGTGKTPLSIEIYKELEKRKFKPALIKKFYHDHSDEHEMIKNKNINLILNKNRKKCILEAIDKKLDIAVLDDGFQDLSINKNLNIICFNSNQLVGNGFLLPAGPLREKFDSIKRAKIIVINGFKNIEFENKVFNTNKNVEIFYSNYIPTNLDNFRNKKLLAFAGIGEPENFFNLLKKNNLNVTMKYAFPDHYNYSEKEIDKFNIEASKKDLRIVTTEKDYNRLNIAMRQNINYLKLNLTIEKKEKFIDLIMKYSI